MNQLSPYTFNWSYLDSRQIAIVLVGSAPDPGAGPLPGLPTLGTGSYEWRGYVPHRRPPAVNQSASGLLVNWNNKPALGFAPPTTTLAVLVGAPGAALHRVQAREIACRTWWP